MDNNPSPPLNKKLEQIEEVDSLEGIIDNSAPSESTDEETAEVNEVVCQDEKKSVTHVLEDISEIENTDRTETLQEVAKYLSASLESASSDKIKTQENDSITINDRPINPLPTISPLINEAYMINAEVMLGANITEVILSEQSLTMRDFLHKDDYLENKFLSKDKSFSSNQSDNKSIISNQSDNKSSRSDSTISNPSDVKTVLAAQSENKSIISNQLYNKSTLLHQIDISISNKSHSKSSQMSNKSDGIVEMPQVNKDDLDENDERKAGEELKQITVSDEVEPSAPPLEETSNVAAAGATTTTVTSSTVINTKQRKKSLSQGKKSLNEIMRKIFKKKKQVANTEN